MNKRVAISMMAAMVSLSMAAAPALAATPPVKAGFTYSTDSDGVILHSYSAGTNDDEAPLNFTVYHNRLTQSGTTINENTLVGKWRGSVGQGNISLWAGYMKNDIRHAVTYAAMYDTTVGYDDHLWVSYGRDAIDTILAHEANIYSNTSTIAYLHKTASDIDINISARLTNYSDNNKQQIYNISLDKQLSNNFKLGLSYGYSTADRAASPVYYVPLDESVLSLKPELTIPLGVGKLVVTAEQSLAAHNIDGTIHRHSIDSAITFGKFSAGTKYYRDGTYNARVSYVNWDTSF